MSRMISRLEKQKFRKALGEWFRVEGRDLPWRKTTDAYAIMVSEFMLQQTQVATVRNFYDRWVERFPDFRSLAEATEAEVMQIWQGLGYYSRARNLHRAAQEVVAKYEGNLPTSLREIVELPGVGRYTAGAIASFAYDMATPIVEVNIARVIARLIDFREAIDTAEGGARIWEVAEELLPERGGRLHNSALMELGALICTPKQPKCLICPVRGYCEAKEPGLIPVKKARRQIVEMDENCGWMVNRGRVLLVAQTGKRWGGLWKLPPRLVDNGDEGLLLTMTYPFTHHRVRLRIFSEVAPRRLDEGWAWVDLEQIAGVAMASGHRRAIDRLMGLGGEVAIKSDGTKKTD